MSNEAVPYGEEFQVNTFTDGNQSSPTVTWLSDGGFVVTWVSDQQDGSDEGVFGQRYAADGSTIGEEFQINSFTTDDQTSPDVTGLHGGGFVVTWQSADQDGNRFGIFGQSYAPDGSPVGDEFLINTVSDGDQNSATITELSNGGFVVTWQSRGQDGSGLGIFGQNFSANGAAVGAEFQVNTHATDDQAFQTVSGLSDGGFVVTWVSEQSGAFTGVFGQRYAANGRAVGGEFQIGDSTSGNQDLPSVAGLSGGGFVVTWSSEQNGAFEGIFGQRYTANGSTVGEAFQVNTYAAIDMSSSSVTGLSNGGFVVTSRASGNIFGQNYAADGSTIGEEFQVNTDTSSYQGTPSITGLTDGDFVVTWQSRGDDGSRLGVFGQRFAVNDAPEGVLAITGTVAQGETLTADTSGMSDADGLGPFSYQWLRNGTEITGATAATYVLGQGDVDATMSVRASYTDGFGFAEAVTSGPTAAVENINDAPIGNIVIGGVALQGQILTADTSGVTDADGIDAGTFTYQWLRDGLAVAGATSESYTLTQADVGGGMSVVHTYTDNYGAGEVLVSAASNAVANLNDVPAGVVAVVGVATQGETLTADASGVSDIDGLGPFSYQWLRNGTEITGAMAATYVLGQGDVDATMSVRASYTDGFGFAEAVTSGPTAAVENINDAPIGNIVIGGVALQGQILTADTSGVTDADGIDAGTFTYQWLRDGLAVAGATSESYTLTQADVGGGMSVVHTYTDNYGAGEVLVSAASNAVANLNDVPAGVVAVVGVATQGETLTADASGVSDIDGLGPFSYQWLRNGTEITGAMAATYVLGQGDVDATMSVRASYTDGFGFAEAVTSGPTAAVENINDAPIGNIVIGGVALQGQILTADTSGVTDADGIDAGTFTYQWLRDGLAVAGATSESYTLTQADVGGGMSVVHTYTDNYGAGEVLVSAASNAVANLNDVPAGVVAVIGETTEGSDLRAVANLADPDGLGPFNYRWQRDGVAIENATSQTYRLIEEDLGTAISVSVSYVDSFGTSETVESGSTSLITPQNRLLLGTPEDDVLRGGGGQDTVFGFDGDDRLIGNGGDDIIRGGDGADILNGGAGDDFIFGGETTADLRDIIYAGAGNDDVDAGFGNDLVYGMDGDDFIAGGFGVDELHGQNGDDVITGSAFSDMLFGGAGHDFVNGGFGSDRVNGGTGADRFYHEGIADHGSDWIQDYNAAEGDVLMWGGAAATVDDFQINTGDTANAGVDGASESFVIYRPTSQIMWALVDGDAQNSINIQIAGQVFDLLV
jgi:alpha-acetolactate decarboxylase